MAIRRRPRAPAPKSIDVDDSDLPMIDDELEVSTAVQELEDAFADMPATLKVKLYRIPDSGEWQWCWTGAPAGVSEERAAKFGPGKYVFVARGELPNGRKDSIRKKRFVEIAASTAEPAPNGPVPVSVAGPSLADQVANATILSLLKTLQDSQVHAEARQREHQLGMAALFKQMTEPRQPDPLMLELLKASLGNRGDPLDLAAKILELRGGNGGRRTSALEELGAQLDALEKLKGRFGDGEGGDGWGGFFKTIATRVLDKSAAEPAAAAELAPASTAPAALPAGPAADHAPNEVTDVKLPEYLQPLAGFVPMLVDAAERDVAPESTAEWLVANIPEAFLAGAKTLLERDTVVADLVMSVPELRPHREWLGVVRTAAIEEVTAALEPDESPESAKA